MNANDLIKPFVIIPKWDGEPAQKDIKPCVLPYQFETIQQAARFAVGIYRKNKTVATFKDSVSISVPDVICFQVVNTRTNEIEKEIYPADAGK